MPSSDICRRPFSHLYPSCSSRHASYLHQDLRHSDVQRNCLDPVGTLHQWKARRSRGRWIHRVCRNPQSVFESPCSFLSRVVNPCSCFHVVADGLTDGVTSNRKSHHFYCGRHKSRHRHRSASCADSLQDLLGAQSLWHRAGEAPV